MALRVLTQCPTLPSKGKRNEQHSFSRWAALAEFIPYTLRNIK
jgi:hypothetical protein